MNEYLLVFLFLFFVKPSYADDDCAGCGYEVRMPSFTYTVSDINPASAGNFTLALASQKFSSCKNFFVTFNKGSYAPDYNRLAKRTSSANYVSYNLYKLINSQSILKSANDAISVNEVLDGTLIKNQTKTMTYYFSYLQPLSSPPLAGTYIDNIQVSFYQGIFPDKKNKEQDKNLNVTIIVPKLASLSLVDPGGIHDPSFNTKTLDFGELATNQELNFDIRMISNAGYQLKVSSVNNGSMSIAGSTDNNSKIAYNFLINNQIINLSSSQSLPVIIASYSGVTPPGGAVITGKAIIQSVEGKNSGDYQDYLTLTIMTTE